ncbi:hypothetical protein FXE36_12725 [Vibrio cholerae]|uniref:hypothetical protein n=1 Tax=Vibrio cholerae TaxID=666 RepID=UPI0011D680E7|nr:hypothetical protein [Vibrio cholerae]TYA72660.1 hypothetical protein FXE36_12725 [Vibrio cholerae]
MKSEYKLVAHSLVTASMRSTYITQQKEIEIMSKYVKIPIPKYKEEVIALFNTILSSNEEWDGFTQVIDINTSGDDINFTLCKSDGADATKDDMVSVANILQSSGFVYEY